MSLIKILSSNLRNILFNKARKTFQLSTRGAGRTESIKLLWMSDREVKCMLESCVWNTSALGNCQYYLCQDPALELVLIRAMWVWIWLNIFSAPFLLFLHHFQSLLCVCPHKWSFSSWNVHWKMVSNDW